MKAGAPGKERLREHLRRHNRWVLVLTAGAFAVAAALWGGLYFVVWWLFLLGGAVVKPLDFRPAPGPLARGFAATAILLCLFAWISRRLRPNQAPQDHKGFAEHCLDLLLAIPRVTLTIFGTAAAAARLNESELEDAWGLLRRMEDADTPVPIQSLPVDIPNPATRKKILLALQLGGLIEIRAASDGPVLAFQNQEARRVAQAKVRLRI